MSALSWTPGTAWQATPRDVLCAHAGWLRLHGIAQVNAVISSDLQKLMVEFPDG
jgi:Phage tail assembly chaperone protein, TAC